MQMQNASEIYKQNIQITPTAPALDAQTMQYLQTMQQQQQQTNQQQSIPLQYSTQLPNINMSTFNVCKQYNDMKYHMDFDKSEAKTWIVMSIIVSLISLFLYSLYQSKNYNIIIGIMYWFSWAVKWISVFMILSHASLYFYEKIELSNFKKNNISDINLCPKQN